MLAARHLSPTPLLSFILLALQQVGEDAAAAWVNIQQRMVLSDLRCFLILTHPSHFQYYRSSIGDRTYTSTDCLW